MAKGKKPNMAEVMKHINAKFGPGAVMTLKGNEALDIESIPTGSFSLDQALGIGGIPKGRIIEIFGPLSSGKTSLAFSIAAQVQKAGGDVVFIDAEHAIDPKYARQLGVDTDKMVIAQPESGEEALNIVEEFIRKGQPELIIIDSVAALTPRAEIEGEVGQPHMALQARMMGQALRKITAITAKTKTTIIFINQIRINISGYGNPETTAGGKALGFYASVQIDVRKKKITKAEEVIGIRVVAKIVKNKVATPFKRAEFDIMFGEGISEESDVLNVALKEGVVKKTGSTYMFGEKKLGVGFDRVRKSITKETLEEIKKSVRAKWKNE